MRDRPGTGGTVLEDFLAGGAAFFVEGREVTLNDGYMLKVDATSLLGD